MKVIDISDWQENLDWQEVLNNNVEGVIIKIAEGMTKTELFDTHLENAKNNGLKFGVYVYTHATNPDEATQEAQNAIELLNGETPELGIWYDIEGEQPFENGVDNSTAMCSAFISECNGEGYTAGVYSGYYNLRDNINVQGLADYVPYWVAEYGGSHCYFKEDFPDKNVMGWQYTESYPIGDSNVDMSEWYTND